MVSSLLWCCSQATKGLSCATCRSCWQRGSRAQLALPSELRKQNGPEIRFPNLTLKPSLCFPKEKSCLHLVAVSTHPSEQLSQSSIPYQQLSLVHFFLEKLPMGLEGKIPPPAISRRDFNNSMRIPDSHLPVSALPKRGMNQSRWSRHSRPHPSSLSHTCAFVLCEASHQQSSCPKRLEPQAVSTPSTLHKGQILTHLHTESQNSAPTSCEVRCEYKRIKKNTPNK